MANPEIAHRQVSFTGELPDPVPERRAGTGRL